MKIYLTRMEEREGPLLCADSWEEAEQAANRLGLQVIVELPDMDMMPFVMSGVPVTLH